MESPRIFTEMVHRKELLKYNQNYTGVTIGLLVKCSTFKKHCYRCQLLYHL